MRTKRPGGSADLLGVASPLYYSAGMSVLDQQQSSDATASDSDDGGHGTPRSAGALAYAGTVFSGQPLGGAPLSPPPAGFVPCEPQSPSASGAHWADQGAGWAAGAPRASTPFLTAASGTLPRGACAGLADFAAPPACAWEPAPAEPPCPASDLAAGHWYFGSLDLACLPMDCSGGGACDCTGPSCCRDDEDEVPLLTLDLGGERAAAGCWLGRWGGWRGGVHKGLAGVSQHSVDGPCSVPLAAACSGCPALAAWPPAAAAAAAARCPVA